MAQVSPNWRAFLKIHLNMTLKSLLHIIHNGTHDHLKNKKALAQVDYWNSILNICFEALALEHSSGVSASDLVDNLLAKEGQYGKVSKSFDKWYP